MLLLFDVPAAERLTASQILTILGALAVLVLMLWGLGHLFPRKYHTAGGNALLRAESFFRPSREHVLEAKLEEKSESEEAGDPPLPGER